MVSKSKDPTLTLLFDADMILFTAASVCETEIEWEPDFWTLHSDAGEIKSLVDERIQSITERCLTYTKHSGPYEILMCFSDDANFRKVLYPQYKANRAGRRKPVAYSAVKQWAQEVYNAYQRPTLEADDCIGILAGLKEKAVIISGDKDMRSIPGLFYNYLQGTFTEVSEQEADYQHLLQTLTGDTADNYPGCPGCGPVGAVKILDKTPTWEAVVAAYTKKGLTEADALVQARVARILRPSDFDFKRKEVILWTPK